MGLDLTDLFGSKARADMVQLRNELAAKSHAYDQLSDAHKKLTLELSDIREQNEELRALQHLVGQQEELRKGNIWLEQVAARLKRHGPDDSHISLLLHDLQRCIDDDTASGASQFNLSARPLLLVVDMGLEQTAVALVKGGTTLTLEKSTLLNIGGKAFEEALALWVHNHFAANHPELNQTQLKLFLPSALRIFSALCSGSIPREIEEVVVVDSKSYGVSLPLCRDELNETFNSILGQDGSLLNKLRQFFVESTWQMTSVDLIVCIGQFCQLPLLRESLTNNFQRPTHTYNINLLTFEKMHQIESTTKNEASTTYNKVDIISIKSDPDRSERDKRDLDEWKRKERLKIERELLDKINSKSTESLAIDKSSQSIINSTTSKIKCAFCGSTKNHTLLRITNSTKDFRCISCNKPFFTRI
jgi:hypothetical protein